MDQSFMLRRVEWSESSELCLSIRETVLFYEVRQSYFHAVDGLDNSAQHVLAVNTEGVGIGTGRIDGEGNISRIVVKKEWRQRGVGTAILHELIAIARDRQASAVFCSVPVFSSAYYLAQAFMPAGEAVVNDQIKYQPMRLLLSDQVQPTQSKQA